MAGSVAGVAGSVRWNVQCVQPFPIPVARRCRCIGVAVPGLYKVSFAFVETDPRIVVLVNDQPVFSAGASGGGARNTAAEAGAQQGYKSARRLQMQTMVPQGERPP